MGETILEGIVADRSEWEAARQSWLQQQRPNTVVAYEVACRQFFDTQMGEDGKSVWIPVEPWEVSRDLVQRWAKFLAESGKVTKQPAEGIVRSGLSPASINLKLSALSSFYDFAREVGLWPAGRRNPFADVTRPVSPPRQYSEEVRGFAELLGVTERYAGELLKRVKDELDEDDTTTDNDPRGVSRGDDPS